MSRNIIARNGKFYTSSEEVSGTSYSLNTNLTRDYDFTGKEVQFFGDSIAYGVGVDSDDDGFGLTTIRWTTRFCDIVGATETNNAVSASLYTRGKNDVISITDKVKESTLSGDYIFLCGGVNDWQLGVPLAEFETAVNECFDYLKKNYSGKVLVVAPFNVIKNLVGTPITSLYEYRKVLAKLAYTYEFDFINGAEFSLAPSRNAGTIIKSQYSDGLHPSGFGHYLVAYEMMFKFTGQNWNSMEQDSITFRTPTFQGNKGWYFSGEYLAQTQVPIWKLTYTELSKSTLDKSDIMIDPRLPSNKAIIQKASGVVLYAPNNNAVAIPIQGEFDSINYLAVYNQSSGLAVNIENAVAINNGNIFITFIRIFDIANRKDF